MTKYAQSFIVGLQSNLVYRWNFGVRSLFWFFHLVVVFILWGAAFASNSRIGGFSFSQTLTYFVVIFVLQFFIGAFNEDYQISEDIMTPKVALSCAPPRRQVSSCRAAGAQFPPEASPWPSLLSPAVRQTSATADS